MPITTVLLAALIVLAILITVRIVLAQKQHNHALEFKNSEVAVNMARSQAEALKRGYEDHGLEYTLSFFTKHIQTSSIVTNYTSKCCTDNLFQELMLFSDAYEVVVDHEAEDYLEGKHQLMVFQKGNSKFLVSVYSKPEPTKTVDVAATSAHFPVEAFYAQRARHASLGEEEVIYISERIRLVCPTDEGVADVKQSVLKEMIEKSKLVFAEREKPPHVPALYTLMEDHMGMRAHRMRLKAEDNILSDKDLKLQYPVIEIPVSDDVVKIEMDKLSQYIVTSIEAKANFSFGHLPGTGKSTLLRHLAFQMARDEKAQVFFLDSSVVEIFKKPDMVAHLGNVFSSDRRNIIFIDQAEELLASDNAVARTFLDMVDGNLSQEYNLSFVVAYNGDIAKFNENFFRAGRFMDIEIGAIPGERAKNLMEHAMNEWLESDEIFDHKKLETLVNNANRNVRGDMYAKQGEVVLSDFVGCIQKKKSSEIFAGILAQQKEEAKATQETKPKAKVHQSRSKRRNKKNSNNTKK